MTSRKSFLYHQKFLLRNIYPKNYKFDQKEYNRNNRINHETFLYENTIISILFV